VLGTVMGVFTLLTMITTGVLAFIAYAGQSLATLLLMYRMWFVLQDYTRYKDGIPQQLEEEELRRAETVRSMRSRESG